MYRGGDENMKKKLVCENPIFFFTRNGIKPTYGVYRRKWKSEETYRFLMKILNEKYLASMSEGFYCEVMGGTAKKE